VRAFVGWHEMNVVTGDGGVTRNRTVPNNHHRGPWKRVRHDYTAKTLRRRGKLPFSGSAELQISFTRQVSPRSRVTLAIYMFVGTPPVGRPFLWRPRFRTTTFPSVSFLSYRRVRKNRIVRFPNGITRTFGRNDGRRARGLYAVHFFMGLRVDDPKNHANSLLRNVYINIKRIRHRGTVHVVTAQLSITTRLRAFTCIPYSYLAHLRIPSDGQVCTTIYTIYTRP